MSEKNSTSVSSSASPPKISVRGEASTVPRQPPSPVHGRWWHTKGIVDAAEADTEVETSTQSGTQPDDPDFFFGHDPLLKV